MLNLSFQVKLKLLIGMVILILTQLASAGPLFMPKSHQWRSKSFISHENYLAMSLKFEPFQVMKKDVEALAQVQLKDRGEAHVTVITPPEWKILTQVMKPKELESIARKASLQKSRFKLVCVGRVQQEASEEKPATETYFVVLDSKDLVKIRQKIFSAAKKRNSRIEFNPNHFYPHITLGFTDRDLHEQDGAIKDRSSCWKKW